MIVFPFHHARPLGWGISVCSIQAIQLKPCMEPHQVRASFVHLLNEPGAGCPFRQSKNEMFFPDICLVATGVNQNRLFRRHPHFHWIIYAYPIIFPAASPETASVSNRTAARTPSSVFSMVHSAPCRAKIIFTRYSPRPLPPVARFREVSSR